MAKVEMSPQEIVRRQFLAKCRFKALSRMALANSYWLIESTDHYEGIDDVKRRVAQAVRGSIKKKRLLNITDKVLLCKQAEDRTDQEKHYIYRIIGGLKCFKRYPEIVKQKLAAVTYFKYYGPGRVIVREFHEAHALYFIVTGDVIVSKIFYDEILKKHMSVDVGVMHPGDMFGEVSLLHNIPRTATCTTAGHCELLALMKEDFKNVLQASVQKDWEEVQKGMARFTYFEGLDDVSRREGCIVAKMKSFNVNDTILGDGVGVPNFVYFVLSGKCQMIESLKVITKTHAGHTTYKLYDPYVPKIESQHDLDLKYFSKIKKSTSTNEPNTEASKLSSPQAVTGSSQNKTSPLNSGNENPKQLNEKVDDKKSYQKENQNTSKSEILESTEAKAIPQPTKDKGESIRFCEASSDVQDYRTYFMQVCLFDPGATFGFGENMRDRRIIALTPVRCMLLPKIWLLQRNTANIWTRIQHYLEKKVPSKKQLFQSFVLERRWLEYRSNIVKRLVDQSHTVNWTSLHDVPYSIRIDEMLDN